MRSREFSLILTILFGWFGGQAFYKGEVMRGVFSLLLFWTTIPALIAFVEFLIDLSTAPEDWDAKYN